MKKKMISAVLAAAIGLSLSAEAFAAAADDKSSQELEIPTIIATPTINIEWPTIVGVVFNPYKMAIKVKEPAAGKDLEIEESEEGSADTTDTLYSPVMTITNKSATAVKVTVTGSAKDTSNIDPKTKLPNPDLDGDGFADYKDATNITFATTVLKQPSYDKTGKLVAGDTKNSILLYLEALTKNEGGDWVAAATYDIKNTNQMIYSTKSVSKDLFTIPARVDETTGTDIKIQFRGDITTQPTNWVDLSKTEKIVISTAFKAIPVAPAPDPYVAP